MEEVEKESKEEEREEEEKVVEGRCFDTSASSLEASFATRDSAARALELSGEQDNGGEDCVVKIETCRRNRRGGREKENRKEQEQHHDQA